MVNYMALDKKEKHELKSQLTDHAALLGGKNHFLSLIEALRNAHPNPLMAKDKMFRFKKGSIKWEKSIFKDKVQLLDKIIKSSTDDKNIMPSKKTSNGNQLPFIISLRVHVFLQNPFQGNVSFCNLDNPSMRHFGILTIFSLID